jgi:hypothetical protein
MIPPEVLPYLLLVPALIVGLMLGRLLKARARPATSTSPADPADPQVEEKLRLAETEQVAMQDQLAKLQKSIAAARRQIDAADREYTQLLTIMDERRASIASARQDFQAERQPSPEESLQTEALLGEIDRSMDELDMLTSMKENYDVKTTRLTQQVHWQESELRLLRQTVKARTAEIEEARALLEQRDAELRLMIRQRQQRDIDINHARSLLVRQDEELKRLLGGPPRDPFAGQVGSSAPESSQSPPVVRRITLPAVSSDQPRLTPPQAEQAASRPMELPAPDRPPESLQFPVVEMPLASDDVDLAGVPHLSKFYADQLRQHGIRTARELAELSEEAVAGMLEFPPHHTPDIAGWLRAASRLSPPRRRRRSASEKST